MSFRGRLTLFFLLIVALPMIAVAVLVTQVAAQSGNGKADARIASGLQAALAVHRQDKQRAAVDTRRLARESAMAAALRSGDRARIATVARSLATMEGLVALVVRDPQGHTVATVGGRPLVAAYQLRLRGPSGPVASLLASTTTPAAYVAQVKRLISPDQDVAVVGPQGPVASSAKVGDASLPDNGHTGDTSLEGKEERVGTAALPGAMPLRLAFFSPTESAGFFGSSPLIVAALFVFFAIAFVFVAMLLRALGGQVAAMLEAARRIGEGDFSRKVPVVGKDEMAGLASEFNKMSDRLSAQMEELRRQQIEIDHSVRRIGSAFASGLDRRTLLQVVVETALGACGAQYGTIALSGRDGAEAEAGSASQALQDVVGSAEGEALVGDDLVVRQEDGSCALASPLRRIGESQENVGAMTVARRGPRFTPGECDVFVYLVGQVSASIENIALHELVSEQAVTDELTGLSNNRRFRELVNKEAARAQRFGHSLSMIMLDIDDFKRVNDTHGHLQGDEVLRMVGSVLDAESRGVDEPARYGGEEFAVALPETDLEGAVELAERIREKIAAAEVPLGDGAGTVTVTASVGAASMPGSADNARTLVAAADAALYQAKRSGKNRVCAAPEASATRR